MNYAAQYYCVIVRGVERLTSNIARMTINTDPDYPDTLLSQAANSENITADGDVTLSVLPASEGAALQWTFDGTAIEGATGQSLAITNATKTNVGYYRVLVNGATNSQSHLNVWTPKTLIPTTLRVGE